HAHHRGVHQVPSEVPTFAAAAHDAETDAQLAEHEGHGPAGPATAQHQRTRLDVAAGVAQGGHQRADQAAETGYIGVVASDAAVVDHNGVHRAHRGRQGVHFIEEGNHGLLVGHGNVQAAQAAGGAQQLRKLRDVRQLEQVVAVVLQALLGETLAEMIPAEAVAQVTSEETIPLHAAKLAL